MTAIRSRAGAMTNEFRVRVFAVGPACSPMTGVHGMLYARRYSNGMHKSDICEL